MSSKARIVKLFIPDSEVTRKNSVVGATIIADYQDVLSGTRVLVVERPQAPAPTKPKRKPAVRKAAASAAALPQSPEVQ